MENFICSRYGERLHILDTENIQICMQFLPKVRWVLSYVFCSKFHMLFSSANISKIRKDLTNLRRV